MLFNTAFLNTTFILNTVIVLIALLHIWFLILEMFLWQKSIGLKLFRLDQSFAHQSAPLAANQGLYNGFLSAGLLWSVLSHDPIQAWHLKIFFLSCVALAGIYGALSVNARIFIIQALPAILTLIFIWITS